MNSLAGLANQATGMQATMLPKMSGAFSGAFSAAGGMKVSLGGQFNMRMSTPNLGRVRGMANPMSAVPRVNMASKLASMFSGGGGGTSFGGSKLSASSSSSGSSSGSTTSLGMRSCWG